MSDMFQQSEMAIVDIDDPKEPSKVAGRGVVSPFTSPIRNSYTFNLMSATVEGSSNTNALSDVT